MEVLKRMEELRLQNMCFEDVTEMFLKTKKTQLKVNSYEIYRRVITKHLNPYFSGKNFSEITSEEINMFVKYKTKEGLSSCTIQQLVSYIKAITNFVECNNNKIMYPKAIDGDLLSEFISVFSTDIDEFKLGMLCVIYTGIRVGELCALKWKDISFEKGEMIVKSTIQKKANNLPAKEDGKPEDVFITKVQKRKIPIPYALLVKLDMHKGEKDTYLLTSSTKPMEPKDVLSILTTYGEKMNIPNIKCVNFRNTFAIKALELGMDTMVIAKIMGIPVYEVKRYTVGMEDFFYKKAKEQIQKFNSL